MEPSLRSNDRVVFENLNEDVMSEFTSTMVLFNASDWEDNIDYNTSAVFDVLSSSDQYLNLSSDVTFHKAMNLKGEISKLSMSIRSCNVSSEPFSMLEIDKPSFSKWEEVCSTFKSVMNPEELEHFEAKISSDYTLRSGGVSRGFY